MWFNKVVGQNKIKRDLHQSIAKDTLSHAMIIEGPSGYGGLPIALSLSQSLLCNDIQEEGISCGACKSCQQVEQLIHPDLHIVFPVVKKDGTERKNTTSKDFMPAWRSLVSENPYLTYNEWLRDIAKTTANGDINVKECNDISQQLNFQSFSGGRKIQIIWIADRLGSNGNKLLKLIEEPPEGTYLILVCDDLDNILGTIQSRCRTIRLPRVLDADIATSLVRFTETTVEEAQQVAFICDGDFSLALEYIQLEQNNLMDICMQWLVMCQQMDTQEIRKWSLAFHKFNQEEQKAILNYFMKIVQSIMYFQLFGKEHIRLSDSDKSQLMSHRYALELDVTTLEEMTQLIGTMITRIERYVNGRMVMFDASLRIGKLIRTAQANKSVATTS